MLAIERNWKQHPAMGAKPRQVFIAESRILATIAEECFVRLMSSLDNSLHPPKKLLAIEEDVEQELEFIDQDDNEQWRSDLPEKFSGLLDEHFPLFVTYDRVWISLPPKHPISPFSE